MASEMPNFRHPPPEAPVRTYPTPDIQDQVLVEWVTSEQAFSRPLVPGTLHANTREFPGFKFGKQEINPRDENWYIRYWVVDQPDPDFYNYAIKFSEESNLHPIIIRSYRELKDGYTPRDKESADPDFAGAILVSEEAKQFDPNSEFYAQYFNVIRVYETLPGPWTTKTDIDRDGIVNVNTRRNLAANITVGEVVVTVGTDRVWRRTTKKDNDSVVTDEIVEERIVPGNTIPSAKVDQNFVVHSIDSTLKEVTDITPGASLTAGVITTTEQEPVGLLVSREVDDDYNLFFDASSSTSIKQVIPDEFLKVLPTYTFSHRLAGTITEPPVLALGELTRKEDQLDTLTFRRSTESLPVATLPITITNYELTERYGGGFLTATLTLDTTVMTPDEGYLVVESFVREMHAPDPPAYPTGLYMKLTKYLAPDTQWPELSSTHVDERYLVAVEIKKQVLPAGIVGGVDPDGTVREVRSIDKWRSLQISSKLDPDTLPPQVTWLSGQRHSFVPELIDAVIDWAEAVCGCSDSFSAVLIANFNQYSGQVKTRMTEQFYNGTPPDDVEATQFCPQSHTFGFTYANFCGSSDADCRTRSGQVKFNIPLCLHGDLSLSVGSHVWTFPATVPPNLPHGTYIMLAPHIERWRFGVFRRVLTEVLVPVCEGIVGGKAMLVSAGSSAYVEKNFGADYNNVWFTFELRFTSAAFAMWGSGSGDFIMALSSGNQNIGAVYEIPSSGGLPVVPLWRLHGGSSTDDFGGPPAATPEIWQTCEMHVRKTTSTEVKFFVNGTLTNIFTDAEVYAVHKVRFGLQGNTGGGSAYFRNIKVGTTRGGKEIFKDDFTSGDLSAWTSQVGTCSVVTSP